jgi:hypothetical protein
VTTRVVDIEATYTVPSGGPVIPGILIVLLFFLGGGAVGYLLGDRPSSWRNPTSSDIASSPGEVGCKGESCTSRDPKENGCDKDADNLASFLLDGVTIELRYSAACEAAWVRVSMSSSVSGYTSWIEASGEGGKLILYSIHGGGEYSLMVPLQYRMRACLTSEKCTKYYPSPSAITTTPG